MRKKKSIRTQFIVRSAAIAAIYIVLTMISSLFGMSSGAIQLRLSEALTVLPAFTPAAVPGLFVGCLVSNIASGGIILDVIFGSIATLIGAAGTRLLRRYPYLAPIPPIISNTVIVPFVLAYAYKIEGTVPYFMLTVGIGEVISCGVFGTVLTCAILKSGNGIMHD